MVKKLWVLGLGLCGCVAGAQADPLSAPVITVPVAPATFEYSAAQPARFMAWGGLSSEVFILPGAMLGVSAPVGQTNNLDVLLRLSGSVTVLPLGGDSVDANGNMGGAAFLLPLPGANLDLLLSSNKPGLKWYAGPSVGTLMGAAWLFGGVAGVQNEFREGNWGYFVEGKVRALTLGSGWLVSPGLNLGLTYRF